jgi:hypothetical protein
MPQHQAKEKGRDTPNISPALTRLTPPVSSGSLGCLGTNCPKIHAIAAENCMKTDQQRTPETPEKTEKDLFKVMVYSTAFSFGVLAAFLASIENRPHFSVKFGFGTVIGFIAGAAAGWLLWWFVGRLNARNEKIDQ